MDDSKNPSPESEEDEFEGICYCNGGVKLSNFGVCKDCL